MNANQILAFLRDDFPDAKIEIQDTVGDRDHYALEITSKKFQGKSLCQQHQMVFKALQGHTGYSIHALSVTTHIQQNEENDA